MKTLNKLNSNLFQSLKLWKRLGMIAAICTFAHLPICTFAQYIEVSKTDGTQEKILISAIDSIRLVSNTTTGTATDIDGNVYSTVAIGTQVWLKENLRVTKYNDGTTIPLVTDATAWGNLTTAGYCWHNDDMNTYGTTYGALYNWYTVNTAKLCPTGWHVPSDTAWTTLETYLGGSSVAAGGKLKETGTTHWLSPNTGATNSSGFTALPGGYRFNYGTYDSIGNFGLWWSSTEDFAGYAWNRYLYYSYSNVVRYGSNKSYGFSVRCGRD